MIFVRVEVFFELISLDYNNSFCQTIVDELGVTLTSFVVFLFFSVSFYVSLKDVHFILFTSYVSLV